MEIQEILGYLLNTGARMIKRKMDACLDKYNITTAQWAVIKLLDTRGELSQAQIAKELLGDRATAGAVIQKLDEKGYIQKKLDSKDRRSYLVHLAPKVSETVKEIEEMAMEIVNEALKGLEEEEVKILYKALNQIILNLSDGDKK